METNTLILTIFIITALIIVAVLMIKYLNGDFKECSTSPDGRHRWKYVVTYDMKTERLTYPYAKHEWEERVYECEHCKKLKQEKISF